jgi:hypothetical protein
MSRRSCKAALARWRGEPYGVRGIVCEALDVVFERIQAGCREDARLPHPAAEHLA